MNEPSGYICTECGGSFEPVDDGECDTCGLKHEYEEGWFPMQSELERLGKERRDMKDELAEAVRLLREVPEADPSLNIMGTDWHGRNDAFIAKYEGLIK